MEWGMATRSTAGSHSMTQCLTYYYDYALWVRMTMCCLIGLCKRWEVSSSSFSSIVVDRLWASPFYVTHLSSTLSLDSSKQTRQTSMSTELNRVEHVSQDRQALFHFLLHVVSLINETNGWHNSFRVIVIICINRTLRVCALWRRSVSSCVRAPSQFS